MKRVHDPVTVARQFLYVRELAGNRGLRVNAMQTWGGGKLGDSWCCFFATMVFDICYQGKCELPRTGSCDEVLEVARSSGLVVETPAVGDIALSMRGPHDAHHIAIVTGINPLRAIAGNTSKDGTSSNGDGVYEHEISPKNKIFVRVPE